MKRLLSSLVMVVFFLAGSGIVQTCYAQTETKTGEGALVGGLLGAVAGGVIGKQKHKTTQGVLIGGALGALGGAAVGSQMKKEPTATSASTTTGPREVSASTATVAPSAVPSSAPVTMKQIVYWTDQGLPSDEIIARIKKAGATFVLAQDDIDYLRKQGVSQRVIEAMQEK